MRIIKCEFGRYLETCRATPGFVYAGRCFGGYPASVLGNPYTVPIDGLGPAQLYRLWLLGRIVRQDVQPEAALAAIRELQDNAVLGCWCLDDDLPLLNTARGHETCHCQVIAKAAASSWLAAR